MATFESDAENLDNFDGLVEEMNIEVHKFKKNRVLFHVRYVVCKGCRQH